MEKQTIKITLEEYKYLRDMLEDYQRLLGEYQLLSYIYQQMTYQPEEEKVKKKNKIGFEAPRKEQTFGRYLIAGMDNTGGGQAHNNLQPYITVYMWKRVA